MKLSVWSSYYVDLSPEDALRTFKEHGYSYCELSDEHALMLMERGDPTQVGAEFGRFASELGVNILQGHLFLTAKITRPEDRNILFRQLDLFRAIGIKNAVLHCDEMGYPAVELPLEVRREENSRAIAELLEYIKGTDIVICLENLRPPTYNLTLTAEDLLYFTDRFKSENLGICLDTGHLNLSPNRNQLEFIEKAGKLIKALHLTDNDATGADYHIMPYGKGNIDFISIVSAMKKLGYEGLYNLEIPGERRAPLEIRGYKLDYIRKMFEYIDKNS